LEAFFIPLVRWGAVRWGAVGALGLWPWRSLCRAYNGLHGGGFATESGDAVSLCEPQPLASTHRGRVTKMWKLQ